ncbi:hypothetical protein PFNF54_02410 [Plasmodium falciparum NF54]|nr:hypothetical protein PFNF54_02410 [Plasmodium falciparum NF54]
MKEVMEIFDRQTSERFHEYDERMKTTRQKCKDKCDKEIQKIILKDKLEKELNEKFLTLQTDIQNDAIPTCVCEKSLADKVEKGCLRCGSILGAAMPEVGSIGGGLLYALNAWKPKALEAAIAAAKELAITEATNAGVKTVVSEINKLLAKFKQHEILFELKPIVNKSNFSCGSSLFQRAEELASKSCVAQPNGSYTSFCNTILNGEKTTFKPFAQAGANTYEKTLTTETPVLQARYTAAVKTAYGGYQTAIIASIVAIVVIVLIMVIIYLILRYRRKKKMKKKLQYIKLLEE